MGQDSMFMMMILVMPSLFGLSLLGEGVHKVMSYDNRGWFEVATGAGFIMIVIFAYFYLTTFS